MNGMAKEKATITIDRVKVAEARRLTGAPTNSATIDIALTQLIRAERIRHDVVAYVARPVTDEEVALSAPSATWSDLADDTDWEAVFGDEHQ